MTEMLVEAAERAGIQRAMYKDAQGGERKRITPHALRHEFGVRNGFGDVVRSDET